MAALCCCCALVLLAEGASAAAAATGKVPDGCVRASRGDVAPIGGDFTPDRGTGTVYVKAGTTAWADGTFCPDGGADPEPCPDGQSRFGDPARACEPVQYPDTCGGSEACEALGRGGGCAPACLKWMCSPDGRHCMKWVVEERVFSEAQAEGFADACGECPERPEYEGECMDKKAALAAVEACEETRGAWAHTCSDTKLSNRACYNNEVLDPATGACAPRCAEKENPLKEGAPLDADYGWGSTVGAPPSKGTAAAE